MEDCKDDGRAALGVDDVLITAELAHRPSRDPDYAAENRALVALAQDMAQHPDRVLQRLAELAMELCRADSAGISVLEPGGERGIFRWHAAVGAFAQNLYGTMPRDASPCATVIARNEVLLFNEGERFFPALRGVEPRIYENLLAPWAVSGEPTGTLWVIKHRPDGYFDAEDARLLESLSRFASAAYQMVAALQSAQAGREVLEQRVEERTRELSHTNHQLRESEALIRSLVAHLPGGAAFVVDQDLRYQLAGGEALERAGFTGAEFVGRCVAEVVPSLAEEYTPYYRRVLAGEPFVREHKAHGRIYLSHGVPLRADHGEVQAALAVSYDITERVQAEAALRASEEKFRRLFDSIDEGLAIVEMIYDNDREIVDMIYRQVNGAYERHGGVFNVVGRSIFDVLPGVEAYWLDLYKRVAKTGEPERVQNYERDVDRWFDVYFSRMDEVGRFVAIVFNDITERKRAEAALRESEERQAFLLQLSDALRPIGDPVEIQRTATQFLGEQLGASRVFYVLVEEDEDTATIDANYTNGVPSRLGRYSLSAFSSFARGEWLNGRTASTNDVNADPRWNDAERAAYASVSTRAGFGIPLIKAGRLVALLGVNQSTPRQWTDYEMELAREVAERTWAAVERARAETELRRSEGRLRALFESIDEGFSEMQVILDEEGHVVDWLHLALNGNFSRVTGIPDITGRLASEVFPNLEGEWFRRMDLAYRTGEPQRFETELAELGRWFDNYITRLGGEDDDRMLGVFGDITERKLAERTLRESEERKAFLLKLSDALRGETDEQQVEQLALDMLADQLSVDRAYITTSDYGKGETEVPVELRRGELPPLVGIFRHADFPESAHQVNEGTLVVEDVETDTSLSELNRRSFAAVQIKALIGVGLRKGVGDIFWTLAVAMTEPRNWSPNEVLLMEEVAERIWTAIERAGAERTLRESEEQFRRAVEEAPIPVIMHAEDGLVLQISRSWTELTGFRVEDTPTFEAWLNHAYGEGADAIRSHMHELFTGTQGTIDIEFPIRTRSGEQRHWSFSASSPGTLRDGRRFIVGMAVDITERTRAEAALRESEERYRTLFESMDEACAVVEVLADRAGGWRDFRFLEVNPAFLKHTAMPYPVGRTAIELLGTPNPRWAEIYGRVAESGEAVRFEEPEPTLDRVFDLNVFRLGGPGSRRVVVLFTDVTARKRRESNQQLLVEIAEELSRLSDEEEIIRTIGAKLVANLNLTCYHYVDVDEERGEVTVRYFWHALGVPPVLGTYPIAGYTSPDRLQAMRAGKSILVNDTETDLPGKTAADASLKAGAAAQKIAAYVSVPYSQDGKWVACFAVADSRRHPWTGLEVELIEAVAHAVFPRIERVRAEQALRQSEERLRLLVDNVQEYALLQTDLDGIITSWNPGAERLFGYSTGAVRGQSANLLFTPEDQRAGVLEEELRQAHAGQRSQDARWVVRKDGSRFWAQWITELVRDENGRLRGIAKVLRDETDRQQAEQATQASLAEKEQLLREVHHRVKNNLQVITSLLNMQASQIGEERVLSLFQETRNRVLAIASIHELLYRAESFAHIALADYARQLVPGLVQFYGVEQRVRLEILGDGATLELERAVPYGMLLNELVSNACKHAFPPPETGTLTVQIWPNGDEIELVVADTGPGLPDGFNYRKATSLGLKLVHGLVRQLGGTIDIQSSAGTTITVRFPATGAEKEE